MRSWENLSEIKVIISGRYRYAGWCGMWFHQQSNMAAISLSHKASWNRPAQGPNFSWNSRVGLPCGMTTEPYLIWLWCAGWILQWLSLSLWFNDLTTKHVGEHRDPTCSPFAKKKACSTSGFLSQDSKTNHIHHYNIYCKDFDYQYPMVINIAIENCHWNSKPSH